MREAKALRRRRFRIVLRPVRRWDSRGQQPPLVVVVIGRRGRWV